MDWDHINRFDSSTKNTDLDLIPVLKIHTGTPTTCLIPILILKYGLGLLIPIPKIWTVITTGLIPKLKYRLTKNTDWDLIPIH